jgi:hypothetical protein
MRETGGVWPCLAVLVTIAGGPVWLAENPPATPAHRSAQASPDPVHEARVLKQFDERVRDYVTLHRRLAKQRPPPPLRDKAEAEEIKTFSEALAGRIKAARRAARPGDILIVEVQPVFRRILRGELSGPGSADARHAILEDGNPGTETPAAAPALQVNAAYPVAAALSTMPAPILRKLPRLPDDTLEYRFVGQHLVLRDVGANLIVDFMTEAVP